MNVNVSIEGVTPLLMNRFREEQLSSKNDDRNLLPREQAKLTAYLDSDSKLYYPTMNIYSCIINAGKFHKQGKNKVTTQRSSLIPAGILMTKEFVYFEVPNDSNFEVDTRPVVIPATGGKVIKHRARLDSWKLTFQLEIDNKMFSVKEARSFVDDAGQKIGLGDFRPERKGFYGRFVVSKWEVES